MRSKQTLKFFDELNLLLKYLYISEDNYVLIKNVAGKNVKIKMKEDLTLWFETDEGTFFLDGDVPLSEDVIEQLKLASSDMNLENKWSDICFAVKSTTTIN